MHAADTGRPFIPVITWFPLAAHVPDVPPLLELLLCQNLMANQGALKLWQVHATPANLTMAHKTILNRHSWPDDAPWARINRT